jgi:hypothetical protein
VNEDRLAAAPAHDAYPAPPAWRPLSTMAVLSLVLALLLAIVAFMGIWWVEVLPIVLGVAALGATGPTKKRGKGLAIAGIVVAAGVGALAFATHRGYELAVERHLNDLVGALDRGDAARVETYAAEPAKGGERIAAWVRRVAALRERLGTYSGEITVGNVFYGFAAALRPPKDVEEVGPRGEYVVEVGRALWARVKFERGEAWFAFDFGGLEAAQETLERVQAAGEGSHPPWVHDVRVYLPRAASGGQ